MGILAVIIHLIFHSDVNVNTDDQCYLISHINFNTDDQCNFIFDINFNTHN